MTLGLGLGLGFAPYSRFGARVVLCESTLQAAHLSFPPPPPPRWRTAQAGPLIISAVSVPVMARGPSSERTLHRGPSYDLLLSHSWRAARAGPLSICLSCFIAPALACGLSSKGALRRRPSLQFPFCLISALPALCVSALYGRGTPSYSS